jgi:hypothetical protein
VVGNFPKYVFKQKHPKPYYEETNVPVPHPELKDRYRLDRLLNVSLLE